MNDFDKSKEQLIGELKALREKLARIESEEARHKLIEDNLRKSEERFRLLIENASDIIAVIDSEGMVRYQSPSVERLLGYKHDELIGQNVFDTLHPEDIPLVYEVFDYVLHHPGVGLTIEYRVRDKNGSWLTFEGKTYNLLDHPNINGVVVNSRDINERKQVEGKLRESERFLNSVFESIQDGIAILDCELNLIKVNPTMEKWFNEDMPQQLGNRCHKVYQGQRERCKNCATNITLKTGKVSNEIITTKDEHGNVVSVYEIHAYPLFDKNPDEIRGVIQLFRDITEKQKINQEMERFERLNLIGKMAASLGHEIRNPMTTVRGFLQLIMGKDENRPYNKQFSLMIDELDRANSIITEFLSLANNRTLNMVEKNINHIINALTPLIEADANVSGIVVKVETNDLSNIMLDEKEIRQLILNLVRNGLEAMPMGGKLTISTQQKEEEVVLAIKDEGAGIEQDLLAKIGTPFFTTKEQGTGLGLAICFSIATRHNAVINIDSGPKGTTFNIHFKVKRNSV